MLFHVRMAVTLPVGMTVETARALQAAEKDFVQRLQRKGKLRHLWRIASTNASYNIFDVASAQQLDEILLQSPLFLYMKIEVVGPCYQPSLIPVDDRWHSSCLI